MTPPPGTLTASEPAVAAPRAAAAPVRADGVELIGQLEGSGYKSVPFLVRRADGQTLQLTSLLFATLACIDGRRSYEDIATCLCEQIDRQILAEDVECLVEEKLRPLGLLQTAAGGQPAMEKANPLLGLRWRFVVSNPRITRRITRPFAFLFRPAVAAPILLAFAAITAWLLLDKGLASATHQALYKPGLLLLIFGLTMISAGFHEFGHAAACRYGGATPGAMGAGLYLVWPAFYTDVTDSYRLGRWGRVRVDIGGLYFNAIFAVGTVGLWWATGWDAVLLIVPAQLFQMLRQLLPFVRFDGYHILADLTGVPDLFAHIKPTLLGLLPTRWRRAPRTPLKRWARVVVTTWVLLVIPILAFSLFMMVKVMPRVAATAWDSLGIQAEVLGQNWADGALTDVAVRVLAMFTIALPVAAMAYLLVRIVRQTMLRAWRATAGRPRGRTLLILGAIAGLVGLAWFWWPEGQYKPIQPHERGTLLQAMSLTPPEPVLLSASGAQAQPLVVGGATTYGIPTSDLTQLDGSATVEGARPRLGLVLTPTDDPDAQEQVILLPPNAEPDAWPFPFNHPRAPRPGDNQALAVNTTDGSTLYDVSFAWVWVTDGSVPTDQRNEAYALASCSNCTTVAVAFQVILVIGQADVVVPENIAVAVNYDCVDCQTYGLAVQLIATLTDRPSDEAMDHLAAIQRELEQLEADATTIPLDELYLRIATIERQILQILSTDDGASATIKSQEAVDDTAGEPRTTDTDDEETTTGTSSTDQDTTTSSDDDETTTDSQTSDDEATTDAESSGSTAEEEPEPTEEPSPAAEEEPVDEATTAPDDPDSDSDTESTATEAP